MDMANVTINIELTSTGLKSYIDTKYFDDSEKVMVDHMRNDDSLSDSFSINQLGYTLDRFLNFGYTKNSYGFRDYKNREYELENSENEIWCFGCSWTEGMGVPAEYSWPARIEQETGITVKNFGVGGGGPFTAHRIMKAWLENATYKPSKIYMLGWWPGRFEYRFNDKYILIHARLLADGHELSKIHGVGKKDYRQIQDEFLSLNNYNEINNNIKELCNYHNVETKRLSNIIDKNFSDDWDSKMLMALKIKQSDFKDLSHLKDWGRDVNNISNPTCHPGIKYQDIIAKTFLKT
tara:strand:- start:2252 stop:3130 length:879 start_codon:yes stop_codon:yes gene_type:complete